MLDFPGIPFPPFPPSPPGYKMQITQHILYFVPGKSKLEELKISLLHKLKQ